MDRWEMQRRIAAATAAWNRRYAERIDTAYPAGSHPHDGQESDYAEHHAVVSAPDHYLAILEEKHAAIIAEYNSPANAAQRRRDYQEATDGTR